MKLPEQYDAAESLEQDLGDPSDPNRRMSFRRAVELDERDAYPEDMVACLNEWGLDQFYIPASCGGRLRSYEELGALLKVVARRDVTVALTHALTYIGSSLVWGAGTEQQKIRLAKRVQNHEQVAIAFHEQGHGNDHLANEVRARAGGDGFVLSGEKWVIGNAIRCSIATVFARTEEKGGPRGFSLFLLEKKRVNAESFSYLPTFKLLGVRGQEMSGIRFHDCLVAREALIGPPGGGLEIALRSGSTTRTLAPALSIGGADTALRAVVDFALSRRLYGDTLLAIPHTRQILVDAFLDVMICDAVLTMALRSLHFLPQEMCVASAVVKWFIPVTIEASIRDLSIVLGARHYLREGHWEGMFQKISRDVVAIRLVHFSSIISLSHLAIQLKELGHGHRAGAKDSAETLEVVGNLGVPLPAFDPAKLTLTSRGRDSVVEGLGRAGAQIAGLRSGVEAKTQEALVRLIDEFLTQLGTFEQRRAEVEREYGLEAGKSPELFQLAEQYCLAYAAGACVSLWLHNRERCGEFFRRGHWLALSLERLAKRVPLQLPVLPRTWSDDIAHELVERYQRAESFSIVPLRLARSTWDGLSKGEGR
jgi:alkylation response protein AidB-like acyl-CoA dehydrogenase